MEYRQSALTVPADTRSPSQTPKNPFLPSTRYSKQKNLDRRLCPLIKTTALLLIRDNVYIRHHPHQNLDPSSLPLNIPTSAFLHGDLCGWRLLHRVGHSMHLRVHLLM